VEAKAHDDLLNILNHYAHQFNTMVKDVLTNKSDSSDTPLFFSPDNLQSLLNTDVKIDPQQVMQSQMEFIAQQSELWQRATKAMMGEQVNPVVEQRGKDPRFAHPDWDENPVYNYLKQAYLINAKLLESTVDAMEFKDDRQAQQAKFYTRQYINSVSPSNYLLSNPEVCEEILKTQGKCMVKGIQNFMRDLEQSPLEAFKITQTDMTAFSLGENIANTDGKIVFQNDLIQLIHYTPTQDTVFETPLLFVPPFINKYYILDLNERKSMVKGLLDEGHNVFMISWVNPTAELSEKAFSDYMHEGPLVALDVVCDITGANKVNMTGFCVGGTLLAIAASYLRAKGDDRIASLTLLTTLLDFDEPGEVGNYITEDTLSMMEQHADLKGVYDGRILGLSFSLLRENNLFWSYFINNYLKGQDPAAFDILYWNSDATNITAACFKEYIRATYWENKLRIPNEVKMDGIGINLGSLDMPVYFLATLADHIVLWQGAYKGTHLMSGDTRFVLAGSGHLAGVINPTKTGKYPHWTNANGPESAEEWFAGATEHKGSWWPDWYAWLEDKNSEKTTIAAPGTHEKYPALEAAPGSYAKKRLGLHISPEFTTKMQ